jgi:predicted transcriptional regulator of viral defense system
MKYLEFYNFFKKYPVFSHQEVKNVFPKITNLQLTRWQKQGLIQNIIRGWYIFSDSADRFSMDEKFLFYVAGKIKEPSYISLEMAFSIYNLIPEGVYLITCVSSKATAKYSTPLANFSYRHLKSSLMFGYELQTYQGYTYKVASLEKAILDYFYLHPKVEAFEDFEGLRLNVSELNENLDISKLQLYLKEYHEKKLEKRIATLLNYLKTSTYA